jgi:hypothetical protein
VSFHENFWVTVGAAAPVIALANVVIARDILKITPAGQNGLVEGQWLRWATSPYLVALLNLAGQATALVVALQSLEYGRNVLPPPLIEVIMGLSFFLLLISGVETRSLRLRREAHNEHQSQGGP